MEHNTPRPVYALPFAGRAADSRPIGTAPDAGAAAAIMAAHYAAIGWTLAPTPVLQRDRRCGTAWFDAT